YQRAIASIQMDNFKSAKSDLEKVLLINNKFLVQVNALSYFLIGETEYFQRNYESAISSYSKFIETTKSIDYTGIASLRLATANKILEKDSEYQRCIQNASLGNLDIPDDHYASRVSEIILADKLPEQVKFYDYSNRIRSAKSVNEVLAVDLSPFSDKEQIQKLRILKSRKLIEFDELEEADVILENVELTSIKFDADFFPLYYLARAKYFFLLKNINQANYFLEKSIDNNEHFFQTKIEAEINFLAKMFKK
ncbi:MAG: hypothetical protein K9G34_08230, partial [Melioribacteraceae bacterium]|nr:hypothetical protein [Melioribacteraceae bacterium]